MKPFDMLVASKSQYGRFGLNLVEYIPESTPVSMGFFTELARNSSLAVLVAKCVIFVVGSYTILKSVVNTGF